MTNPTPLHVHVLWIHSPEALADLRSQLADNIHLTTGEDAADLARCDVLVGGRPSRDQLSASPNLRALIIPWAGLPPETRAVLAEFPGISVHNLHHNAAPVAELALGLLLAAAKSIVPYDQALRTGDWTPRYTDSREVMLLAGKTALILGYGAIGRRLAVALQALGMTVLATRRHPPLTPDGDVAEIYPPEALADLLPRADALIVALPLTSETEGLLGAAELALLPAPGVLVNIGRAQIIDEQALYEALRHDRISAGLDVWYQYPAGEAERNHTAPANFPFGELPNVVLSPHRAGHAVETETLRMAHLAKLLNSAAASQAIPNRVDLQSGY